MKFIAFLSFILILFSSCTETKKESIEPISDSEPVKELSTAETIAYKNGYEKWKNISEINFTFNVERGAGEPYARSWKWNTKNNEIKMITPNGTVSYDRDSLNPKTIGADKGFINDTYWLLAPFNLLWDEGTTISEKQNVIAPISKETMNQLTLTYGSEGGYTPGDAYDFYYGKDFMIKEWAFRKGNDSIASMVTTWEDYEDFNGIKIAKMHQDSTKTFKLFFTDISLK